MGQLATEDLELIGNYKRAGVLENINAHLLDARNGISVLMCGDPDQHGEALTYKKESIVKLGCLERIHPPAPLGGALRLAPDSPANQATPGYDFALLYDMMVVHEKKNIDTFALYVHAPCAIASMHHLGFADIIRLAFAAKIRSKESMPAAKVAVFVHIDFGDGDRKTFYVCRQKWEQFHSGSMSALALMYPARCTIRTSTEF